VAKVFRVFLSSTFKNWALEREHLRTRVFPEISAYCEKRGARFLPVDLRWGVSESACRTHDAVEICLEEVHRCQRLTPKPNFLVMLGDRYGWRPIPRRLNADFMDALNELDCLDGDAKALLSKWYQLDRNNIPPQYCLHEIIPDCQRYGEFVWRGEKGVTGDEYKLRKIFDMGAVLTIAKNNYSGQTGDIVEAFIQGSVTEQEMLVGAFQSASPDHVHGFIREFSDLPRNVSNSDYLDWDFVAKEEDDIAGGRLKKLKAILSDPETKFPFHDLSTIHGDSGVPKWEQYNKAFHELSEGISQTNSSTRAYDLWREGTDTEDVKSYLDAFGDSVKESLITAIDLQITEQESGTKHSESNAPSVEHYVTLSTKKGEDALEVIQQHRTGAMLVYGSAGSGKSTLMNQALKCEKDEHVLDFWIGRDSHCASGMGLLRSILSGMDKLVEKKESREGKSFNEMVGILERYVDQAPVTIYIDAIDQLPAGDPAKNISWIPLHKGRFIVSTLDEAHKSCRSWKKVIDLVGLSESKLEQLLEHWLAQPVGFKQANDHKFKKDVFNSWLGWSPRQFNDPEGKQFKAVIDSVKVSGNPLHLKVLFEIARHWRSWDHVPENEVCSNVEDSICSYFQRLISQDVCGYKHQEKLVKKAMGYIGASRFGLSEKELLTLLSDDQEVMAEFRATSINEYPTLLQLPELIWSRLYHDLEPFIAERHIHGELLLDFYHAQFRRSLNAKWLAEDTIKDCRMNLAGMHAKQWKGNKAEGIDSTARLLHEMPWMLSQAECTDELFSVMRDDAFLKQLYALDAPALMDALEMSLDKARYLSEVVVSANLFRKLVEYQPGSANIYVSERLEPWNKALWQLFYAQKYLKNDPETTMSLLKEFDVSVLDEAPPANYTGCYYDLLGALLFNNGLAHEMACLPAVVFGREGLRKRYFESLQDHADIEHAVEKARNDDERLIIVRHFLDYEDGYNATGVIDSMISEPKKIEAMHLLWHQHPDCPAEYLEETILPILNRIHNGAVERKQFSDQVHCIEAKARFIASAEKDSRCDLIIPGLYHPMWQFNGMNIQPQTDRIKDAILKSKLLKPESVVAFFNLEAPNVFGKDEIKNIQGALEKIEPDSLVFIKTLRNVIILHLKASIKLDSMEGGTRFYDASARFMPWMMLLVLLDADQVELLIDNVDITSGITEVADVFNDAPKVMDYISTWMKAWSIKYHASVDKNSIRGFNLQKIAKQKNSKEAEGIISNMYGTDPVKGYAIFAERRLEGEERLQWLAKALRCLDSLSDYSVALSWGLSKLRLIHKLARLDEGFDVRSSIAVLKDAASSLDHLDQKIMRLEIKVLEKELGLISSKEVIHFANDYLDEIPYVDYTFSLRLIDRLIQMDQHTGQRALELMERISLGKIPSKLFPEYGSLGKDGWIEFKNLSGHIEYELLMGDSEDRAKEAKECRDRLALISQNCIPIKHAVWFEKEKKKKQPKEDWFSWQTLFQMLYSDATFTYSEEIIPEHPLQNAHEALTWLQKLPLTLSIAYFVPVLLAEYEDAGGIKALYESFPGFRL